MANIPQFSEDQIMQLQASGKITPVTAEKLRTPAEGSSLLEGGLFNPYDENAEQKRSDAAKLLQGGYFVPEEAKRNPLNPMEKPVEVPSAEVNREPVAVEKIDPSMFANAQPAKTAPQKPVNVMQSSGLGSAFGAQEKGLQALGEAQAGASEKQAQLLDVAAEQVKQFDQKVFELSEQRKQAADAHLQRLNEMQKEVEAKSVINPNRYWESRSTGQKIAGLIGIMFGAVGASMAGRGGENPAMAILNKAIDADIDAQKSAYQNAKGNLGDKQNAYAMAMNELGNQQGALLAAKSSALSQVEMQMKSIAARAGSQEAKAKAQIAIGQVQEEKAKLNAALMQSVQGSTAARQAATSGVEDPNLLPDEIRKRSVKMPDGLWRPAVTEQAAKTVGEVLASATPLKGILSQMRELNNPALPYSVVKEKAAALRTEYILLKKNVEQLGVLSETDKALIEDTLGNPGGFRPDITEAKLALAEKNLDSRVQSTLAQNIPGYKPLTKGQAAPVRK